MKLIRTGTLLIIFFLTGCASIVNYETQAINVSSSSGSDIDGTVDGKPFKAPGVVNVQRGSKDKIFFTETEGCAKETVAGKSVDSAFFANILMAQIGLIGAGIDYLTDRMWKYEEHVIISCKK